MGLRLPNFKRIYETTGVNIFSVDYRGYGLSTGSPSEQGLLLDAEAALDALLAQPDVHTGRIAVFGRSLGGAVATHLAYKRPEAIKAVVLENTFLNISKMVDKLFPILVPLKPWILTLNFNTSDKIQYVRAPILLFSGGMDQLVPPSHMEELYELARRTSKGEAGCIPSPQLAVLLTRVVQIVSCIVYRREPTKIHTWQAERNTTRPCTVSLVVTSARKLRLESRQENRCGLTAK